MLLFFWGEGFGGCFGFFVEGGGGVSVFYSNFKRICRAPAFVDVLLVCFMFNMRVVF